MKKESSGPSIARPVESRKDDYLIALSENAQRGLLQALKVGLVALTDREVSGGFAARPDLREELDEARMVYSTLTGKQGRYIDLAQASALGIVPLVPRSYLSEMASSSNLDDRERAKYLLIKKDHS